MRWRLLLAAAMLAALQDPALARSCAEDMPAACLRSLGAGAIPAAEAEEAADCPGRLAAYRECVASMVAQRGDAAPAGPLSRAERGFIAALEAELAENVGRLDAFAASLDLTGAEAVYETDWPALRLRFFNATDNPAYFAAPAEWLARAQGFYDDVARLLARPDVREAYRRQVTSVLYERRLAKEKLQELVALGRDALLPEISAVLAEDAQ